MKTDKKKALQEAQKVLDFILKEELTDQEKDQIVKDAIQNFNENVNPGWLAYRKSVSTDAAFVEWEDSVETFKDLYGNEFIDCLGGFGIYTCGHRNPEILKYVQAQLNRYALHSQELVDPLRGYLANILAMATPGDLQYAFFCNGGAEAVEMALKLARLASGKNYYISTVNGFHGKSLGAVTMGGKGTYRKPYLPMIQGVQHVEFGDADAAEKAIKNLIAVGETVAAMIVEPIQGEAGIILPPDGYLKRLREICDKYDVILIFDEIQTGMGRTGTMWAAEYYDVVPDIMTFGKAFGGGVMPITGIIARPHLWTEDIKENPWVLGSPTFGGNPVCCAAAIATIKYMLENDLPAQIDEKGKYMMGKLYELQKKHPILVDIRGKGLLIGLEYPTAEMGWGVSKGLFKRGVMTGGTLVNSKVNRIEPPGIISYETIDTIIERLDETLTEVEEEFNVTWESVAASKE
ncbi:putrescine aminotransferase [Natronincola ferrireducens]|uniref:Putrescine aminotransferase n=1 Tax=Natronincola ferrireducens TaxID=393762 RepID=A0A1G8YJG1_9FIRM|nr:putrescine aminotransferase [Natronincola ferrireducens]SDK03019.1 putrescine aminotransferase [Natronincola ferrireducens]